MSEASEAYARYPGNPKPIDEICQCGRLRSQHPPLMFAGHAVNEGHGSCLAKRGKFTWKDFIFSTDDPRYIAAKSADFAE